MSHKPPSACETATPEIRRKVDRLLDDTRRNGGLAPVDLEQFWGDNGVAVANPFGPDTPQCPFGAMLTHECVFAELGIAENYWRQQHDPVWAAELNRRYNDLAEKIVGRRILNETPPTPLGSGRA